MVCPSVMQAQRVATEDSDADLDQISGQSLFLSLCATASHISPFSLTRDCLQAAVPCRGVSGNNSERVGMIGLARGVLLAAPSQGFHHGVNVRIPQLIHVHGCMNAVSREGIRAISLARAKRRGRAGHAIGQDPSWPYRPQGAKTSSPWGAPAAPRRMVWRTLE